MKTPEERFYQSILRPLVENHTFQTPIKGFDNKGLISYQRQILTLGLQKYMARIQEGIEILEYFGEWKPRQTTEEEFVALQSEQTQLLAQGIKIRNIKDILGIDEDQIDLYHARTQDLIDREEYFSAASVALLVLTLTPNDPAAWISFAIAEQLSGQLVRGAYALVAAIEMAGGDLSFVLYSVKALYQLGLVKNAKELLQTTIESAKKDDSQRDFRKKAYMLYCSM